MKHTTVCGKSADRPIGGPCRRKPRPRTMIETVPVWSPPSFTTDWLFKVSCHKKEEIETDPSYRQMLLVRSPKQVWITLWLIGLQIFLSMSITWISSCKPETSPRSNVIGRLDHILTSQCMRCLGSGSFTSLLQCKLSRAEVGCGTRRESCPTLVRAYFIWSQWLKFVKCPDLRTCPVLKQMLQLADVYTFKLPWARLVRWLKILEPIPI